jgi:hypothetical protein
LSKPPPLDLPRGGRVEFVDFDDVTGKDYRRLRTASTASNGERVNDLTVMLAEIMVDSWDIPQRPSLSIPRRDPRALDKLHYRDLYTLEKYMLPMYDKIISGEDGDEPDEETGESPLTRPATD